MKTIEERAIEYANRHKATEFAFFGSNRRYSYERVYNADIVSYERGAKEQKAIDIEEVCEWLKARNVLTEASLEGFRKTMEE